MAQALWRTIRKAPGFEICASLFVLIQKAINLIDTFNAPDYMNKS